MLRIFIVAFGNSSIQRRHIAEQPFLSKLNTLKPYDIDVGKFQFEIK